MPSITIREKDLTSAGNLEVTTNAVYIPGYANMGPVNTPVMCETLEDFQQVFGSEPYIFRNDQEWPENFDAIARPDDKFYYQGEQEKSYIMAVELLKLGLPVLYERVFNFESGTRYFIGQHGVYSSDDYAIRASDNLIYTKVGENSTDYYTGKDVTIDSWTAFVYNNGHIIKSVDPGKVSSKIKYSIEERTQQWIDEDQTEQSGSYYVLTVGRDGDSDLGISKVDDVITNITFNKELNREYPSIILVKTNSEFVDNSGLVTISIGNNNSFTQATNINLQLGVLDDAEIDEVDVQGMYDYLEDSGIDSDTYEAKGYERLLDNGEYVIKFITSGAYPVFEYNSNSIASKMLICAADKGNCTALVDHTPNNERKLQALNNNSVYSKVSKGFGRVTRKNKLGEDAHTYGAMFTPYGVYQCTSVDKDVVLPASFGYLAAYAVQIQQYNGWLATAGCTRGLVPNLKSLCQNVTNAIADSYQPRDGIAINAITNIKPYGLTIWGARTLKDNAKKGDLTATSFLNIRQLTNDVKRTTWVAAKTLTYEQNNDMLWIKFKMNITPLLNQMVSGSAISAYEFKKESTTKKATVKASIRLYAIEPVEDWDITIELADSSTEIIG